MILHKVIHLFKSTVNRWTKLNPDTRTYIIISLLCGMFIGFGYRMIENEYYAYAFIPLALLGLLFLKYQFTKGLYLIALFTPLSINYSFGESKFTLSLPTEPIMILMLLMFLWTILFEGKYPLKYLKHPISITILLNISWMLICSIFSTDPFVSFKYVLSRLWFVVPFFFVAIVLLQNIKSIKTFIFCYSISLLAVIIYSTINLFTSGIKLQSAHFVMQPFYNDHTAYGAIIALMLPVTLCFTFSKKSMVNKWQKLFFTVMSTTLLLALILSYARAAWLSVIVALGVFAIVKLNIKFRDLIFGIFIIGLLLSVGWQPIMQRLEKNAQDSSGNILKHITSMSNISTDASNVERLNRWSCALRMFKEYPIFGFGPGTYQFEYAPYQKSWQKTWISTDFGTLGNAHSDYLGPLAETGFLGTLSVIFIFGTTIFVGIRTYHRCKKQQKSVANLSLWLTISLITYYVHGFLNNFLDTDKLSVPFWAFTAAIAALDLWQRQNKLPNSIKV